MKRIFKSMTVATSLIGLTVAAFAMSPFATADSPGQIGGGDIYRIKNITQNVDYTDPASANACDVLEYKVRLHNSGFDSVTNVVASANLPSNSSTTNVSKMTITYSGGVVSSVSDTATLNLTSAQSVSYVGGSTQLLDSNNNLVKSLPDGVTQGGVNIGTLNGSTVKFVQFEAKTSCPTPPKPTYTCDALNITAEVNRTVKITQFSTSATNGASFKNAVISWGDNSSPLTIANPVGQSHQYGADGTYTVTATAHFTADGKDVTAGGPQCQKQVTFSPNTPPTVTPPTTPATPAQPTALVNTGPGSVAALFAIVTAAGTVLYRRILTCRLTQ